MRAVAGSSGPGARRLRVLAGLLLVLGPAGAQAQDFDRVVLRSGETLLGDLTRIHDGDVFFDSEELEELELDLSDVAEIHSSRVHTYRLSGRRIHSGSAVMQGDGITIQTASGPLSFSRGELVAMQEGEPSEINYWSGLLSLGLALRQGNTTQSDFTAVGKLTRRTPLTRVETAYNGAMSTQEGDATGSSHRGNARFDVFLTPRLFLNPASVEVYSDRFQNISLRVTPSAGLGYDLFANGWLAWDMIAGVGYQYTKAKSVSPGESRETGDVATLFSTSLELDPTDDVEWDTEYKLQLIPTDLGKTNHHLLSVLSVELFGPIDLDVSFTFDRIERPPVEADGTRPKSNDFRISVGFGIDF